MFKKIMILLQHLQIMRYCLEIYTQLVLYIGAFIFGVCEKNNNREFPILRYLMKRGLLSIGLRSGCIPPTPSRLGSRAALIINQ